jgi:iron complex outermembrane recepter protein
MKPLIVAPVACLLAASFSGSPATAESSDAAVATPPAVVAASVESTSAPALEEITVTARKKDERALNVPVSITVFSAADLEKLDINSFTDYATKVPNLTFSYGTANYGYVDSHTIAIRGISGVGTTGFYIDETPVPDSLDPRVVDVARIEVLRGPQGTLFGQSSLGGNLRLITVTPTPGKDEAHYEASLGATSGGGSPDYDVNFAASHTLMDDMLAVRAVGFYDHESGYMHRQVVDPNTNELVTAVGDYGAVRSYGGSVAARLIANEHFEAMIRVMAQVSDSDGWTAPYAPLPSFSVQSLTNIRTNDVPEMARDRFYLPSLQLTYKGDGYTVNESLSYFDRDATQLEDGSEGTRYAFDAYWAPIASLTDPSAFPYAAGIAQMYATNEPWAWTEEVSSSRTTSETRVSFNKTRFGLSGVGGVYWSRSKSNTYINSGSSAIVQTLGLNADAAVSDANGTPSSYCHTFIGDTSCSTYGTGLGWISSAPIEHDDAAVFGELYYEVGHFEVTAGGRYYHQTQSGREFEAGALNFSELNVVLPSTKQDGVTPKLAVKYNVGPAAMVYASFSKGFRAGGAGVPLPPVTPASFMNAIGQQTGTPTTYTSDFVRNYEIGGKVEFAGGRVSLTGALFQMNWSNIQQTIVAPVSQIALVVNAGDARVRGGEVELDARPRSFLDLHAGLGYEEAIIVRGPLYWQPAGSAVYNTPKLTANASGTITLPVSTSLSSFLTVDGSYVGSSYSGTAACQLNAGAGQLPEYPNGIQFFPCPTVSPTTTQGYAPQRAGYSLLNARAGLSWGRSELALYLNNLTNVHPNIGDYNPSSYPTHDAVTGYLQPRVATLRPFNVGLQFRQRF